MPLQILIKTLTGQSVVFNTRPTMTVAEMKQILAKQIVRNQSHAAAYARLTTLIFAGKLLEDTQTVASLRLSSSYTLGSIIPIYAVCRLACCTAPPVSQEVWILIKGCTESPNGICVSKRKGYNGDYLYGMKYDFAHMQEYIEAKANNKLYNMISNMVSLKKQHVLDAIADACKYAAENNVTGVNIYYTGHGETNTGNWCLSDGVISLADVLTIYRQNFREKKALRLYVDCCYAGEWALELRRYKKWDVMIKAACWPGKIAYDDKSNGGIFTSFISKRRGVANKDKRLNWCYSKISPTDGYTIKYVTATGVNI